MQNCKLSIRTSNIILSNIIFLVLKIAQAISSQSDD